VLSDLSTDSQTTKGWVKERSGPATRVEQKKTALQISIRCVQTIRALKGGEKGESKQRGGAILEEMGDQYKNDKF